MCLNWKKEVCNHNTVVRRFHSPLTAAILEAFMFITQPVKLEGGALAGKVPEGRNTRGGLNLDGGTSDGCTRMQRAHLFSFIGVLVGVILQGKFPVGFLQFLRRGIGFDAQNIVVGRFVNHSDNLAELKPRRTNQTLACG